MTKAISPFDQKLEKCIAIYIGEKYHLNPGKIRGVSISKYEGGFCDTCGYTTVGFTFYYGKSVQERETGNLNFLSVFKDLMVIWERVNK